MKSHDVLSPKDVFHLLTAVTAGERFKIGCLFFYTFATAGAYVVGRAAADSLFLSRVGPAQLPNVYLLSAGLMILCSVVYGSLARRFALKPSVLGSLLVLGFSSLLGYRFLLVFDQSALLLTGLYLLAELRGGLNTIHYKTLASDLLPHDCRQRAVGLLGASATLAAIVLGGVCAYNVRHLGAPQLLCIAGGLELVALIPILLLPRVDFTKGNTDETISPEYSPPFAPNSQIADACRQENPPRSNAAPVLRIAALMASMVIVSTLIEYQWKVSGAASFAGKENELAAYFGLFYVVVNVLTGAVQLLLTGRILRSIGTHYSLIVFPVALLAGISTIAFSWSTHGLFIILTCLKGCDVFKRGINNPALLMLYSPLSRSVRRRAIVWVTGIVKPFSEAASAILILILARYGGGESLYLVVFTFLVCWVLLTVCRFPSPTKRLLQSAMTEAPEQSKRLHELLVQIAKEHGAEAHIEERRDPSQLACFGKSAEERTVLALRSEGPARESFPRHREPPDLALVNDNPR